MPSTRRGPGGHRAREHVGARDDVRAGEGHAGAPGREGVELPDLREKKDVKRLGCQIGSRF